jgi:hypothetical protein
MNHEMNIQESNNIKNLYKGISTSKKQDIALKANKSKKKKVLIESRSEKEEEEEEEEEDEDNEREYDEDEVALFIKKFNKFIKKRRPYKGERKEKPRSKSMCYNYGKHGNFIAQCPYERKEEYNDKRKKFDKGYKKDKKYTKKPYGQAHVGQEWNSSDEGFESESDEVTTIPIKGKASSSKSLFPKLSRHTCLMAKQGRKKVKSNTPSSPKYVTSDEDTLSSDNYDSSDDDNPVPSELVKNLNAMIKDLMRQVGARDELLEQQEELLVKKEKLAKNSRSS